GGPPRAARWPAPHHTGARKLFLAVQAPEHAEQLVVISHVEAGAVVLHVIDVPRIFADAAQFDRGDFPRSGKLDRVGKQVEPDLADERAVAPADGQLLQDAVSHLLPGGAAELVDN